MEEIEGEFDSVRYSKEDESFLIGTLADRTVILGPAGSSSFVRGMTYRFSGQWINHDKFGVQFKFINFVAKEPVTEAAVLAYLEKYLHGTGSGIGIVKSRKLIAHFGPEKTLSAIKSLPHEVAAVIGITLTQAQSASATLVKEEKFEATRMQLVQLFQGRGFFQTAITQAIKDFGVLAAHRIKRDPFTMLVRRYPSAGFLRCDQLYRDLGLPEGRLKRQTICLWDLLNKSSGSVWLKATDAIAELNRLISSKTDPKKAIELGVRAKWLSTKRTTDGLWISERDECMNERMVCQRISELIRG